MVETKTTFLETYVSKKKSRKKRVYPMKQVNIYVRFDMYINIFHGRDSSKQSFFWKTQLTIFSFQVVR